MPKDRYQFISAAHLFLIKDNQVLLLKRANTGYEDGNYSVPAGHLDGKETATQCMVREALEEAVITIAPQDLRLTHVMHRNNDPERIDFFFMTDSWQGEPSIGEPDKCSELTWFSLDDLPENTIPYVKSALENYLQNNPYSEFGWN